MDKHVPVLLEESLAGVTIKPEGRYIDATFGRGGHSKALLSALSGAGRLLVIDKDPLAVEAARQLQDSRLIIRHGSFAELASHVKTLGWEGKVDGILMDLGVSSPQLDQAERGFSFLREGPLDMRMDSTAGQTAAEWLAAADESVIADIIWRYGEERWSRRIARAIVNYRAHTPIETTTQLAHLIETAVPKRPGFQKKKHPATQTFQAIRMHLNQELQDLECALEQALCVLAPGGRLAVISFHSLEDRLVKQFMRRHAAGEALPPKLPVKEQEVPRRLKLLGRAIKASQDEIAQNARARSARLRVAEKIT